jgi:hypothetical protein
MNTEDGELIEQQEYLDLLVNICRFLEDLQDNYNCPLNDFCPADITLSKNGKYMFAKVKDKDDGTIILHTWMLEDFKNSKVY